MSKVAILIPCYNEELTITKVVEDAFKAMPEAEVYVYDNNSKDNTFEIAQKAGAIVKKCEKQGKGNVLKQAFEEIDADVYVTIDGDDTYDFEKVPEMVNKVLNEGCDMVIGDRLTSSYFTKKNGAFHNFGNRLVRFLVNHMFHYKFTDVMTGLRAMSRNFAKSIKIVSKGFQIETEFSIYAAKHKLKIDSVEINYKERPEGSKTKTKAIRDGAKIVGMIFKLKFKRSY